MSKENGSMIDQKSFNDAPISSPQEDHFGIDPFAKTLARNIRDLKAPIGITIALNGAWGSGKSSAVNLIRHHLKAEIDADQLTVIDFKCWWFNGQEALTLAFLQELNNALRNTLADKTKDLIPRIGKTLLQGGAVIGPAVNLATGGVWGAVVSGSMDFAKRFFSEKQNLEVLFNELSKELQKLSKRFLIVIDDIDRLDPAEAILIFRLIKSVGRLPNIMYLLVFDRELAEKNVQDKYPSEGPHFLEKIIQASFELPLPARDDLNQATLSNIDALCGGIPNEAESLKRFMNVFYDAIAPYINLPRDLTRLCNSISIGWSAVTGEVNLEDFVALETMRLFEPRLYNEIRQNKETICGVKSDYGRRQQPEDEIKPYLDKVNESNQERAKLALMRLFPRFENVGYSSDFIGTWESQRRVCARKHFDTYFRMSLGDETLSMAVIEEFIKQCHDKQYVKRTFLDALKSVRKNGKSKVPLLLDELNAHAAKIEKDKHQNLISALFEIADDLKREGDEERGSLAIGDNNLRIHWLIRKLTLDTTDINTRDKIFMSALEHAQLSWLIDFGSSAIHNHFPRQGKNPEPLERCLIKKESVEKVKKMMSAAIRESAKNGSLLTQKELPYILYRWRDLAEDQGAEVKAWTSEKLNEDCVVPIFAEAFTSQSWSQSIGFFGLGDRVAIRNSRASVEGIDSIIDTKKFRCRLKEAKDSGNLNANEKSKIETFIAAWEKKTRGED